MAGQRLPFEVVEARGKKHFTEAEAAQRKAVEIKAEPPKQLRSPDYLPEGLRKEFLALGNQLKELGIFCRLDYDTLARYLIARQFWQRATNEVTAAMKAGDAAGAEKWTGIQDKYFKQCRNCANDLGMTIGARCRLVVPQRAEPEENPLEVLLKGRRQA